MTLATPVPTPARWRRLVAVAATLALLPAGAAGASAGSSSGTGGAHEAERWAPAPARLSTPWTARVSPRNALPEYPRPQLRRPAWRNLNGLWQFAGAVAGERPPFGQRLAEQVLVPYPIESALSGVQRHEDYMWYRRLVTVPKSWRAGKPGGKRLLLHFGAVDYRTKVYVNGTRVATHVGGYGAFSADITRALKRRGRQEILVGVEDRTDATWQPVGKQRRVPDRGIFYEGASGIWQTVWMEPVARRRVANLDMTPVLKAGALRLHVDTAGSTRGLRVEAVVRDRGKVVSRTRGPATRRLRLPVPRAHLWTPDDPHLYGLSVRLKDGRRTVDTVRSYFGMRQIGKARGADGRLRITLNGKPLFLLSTLDQGYWPDGIYTAPTDEALRFDLVAHKRLGFNTVRKHIKTEPDRWYYHADRLGLMVWQDMPSMRTGSDQVPPAAQAQFERELHEIVDEKKSWTSIIGWVPFNEGWGEWDRESTGRIARSVKAQDPSRLVNAHSGVNCCASKGDSGQGDVIDWHEYVGPARPVPDASRVSIDGEHGGFGLEVPGHMWFEDGHAYEMTPDSATLTQRYVDNQEGVLTAARSCAISGSIYTQITDVEHEVNGFLTYDRRIEKMDFARVRAVNRRIIAGADGSGTGGPSPNPGTPGLAGAHAYSFDEGSGTTAADGVGDADATLTNASWEPGVRGTAASFAGDGEADTGASLIDTTGSYSVSAYARLDEATGAFQTVVSQDTGTNSAFFLQYSGQDQRWAFSFVGLRALSPTKPEVGRWYHLTGVRNAAAGTIELYVDGVRVASRSACAPEGTGGHTVIGRGQFGGNEVDRLRGDVDDVRIFDRALTATEVAQLSAP